MSDPYALDPGRQYVINFSGGRSSGYMLRQILDASGRLPSNAHVIFTNTGKERPETLDFVQRCGTEWDVPIIWLEYRYRKEAKGGRSDPKHWFCQVSHNSASRSGEPFTQLIDAKKMLPNAVMRFCTSELKVRTTERWMRDKKGLKPSDYTNLLGIRYDEPNRWSKALMAHCTSDFPMVHGRVTKAAVNAYWAASAFDLGITSEQGNCDLCFLKGWRKLLELVEDDPSTADWWIAQEAGITPYHTENGIIKKSMSTFRKEYSYAEIKDEAVNPRQMLLDLPDEPHADCFCGD